MMTQQLPPLCFGFALLAFGCSPKLAEEGHPCPCSSQWTCCATENVCVPPGSQCPLPDTGVAPGDDAAAMGDSDSSPPEPPACVNPGPFTVEPSATSLPGLIVGHWTSCGNSLFAGAGVPLDEVAIVIRGDGTWQKVGVSNGQPGLLWMHYDYGTWSSYGGGCCGQMIMLSWDTSSLAVGLKFDADGQSLLADTSAGGNQAILAKTGDPVPDGGELAPDTGPGPDDASPEADATDSGDAGPCGDGWQTPPVCIENLECFSYVYGPPGMGAFIRCCSGRWLVESTDGGWECPAIDAGSD
jgi:hypothetical protein